MDRKCGCVRGKVEAGSEKIIGSVGISAADMAGSIGLWVSDIAGTAEAAAGIIAGSVHAASTPIIGQISIICTPSTELFIKVSPEMVWLTRDMFSDMEFEVVSNTDWTIEE